MFVLVVAGAPKQHEQTLLFLFIAFQHARGTKHSLTLMHFSQSRGALELKSRISSTDGAPGQSSATSRNRRRDEDDAGPIELPLVPVRRKPEHDSVSSSPFITLSRLTPNAREIDGWAMPG